MKCIGFAGSAYLTLDHGQSADDGREISEP